MRGANPISNMLDRIRKTAFLQETADWTDGQLLEWYLTQHDEAAFEVLVRRHGAMVMSVCRRILGNPHDADDAFQATFLVLVRKAASIVPREMVASWLYGAAFYASIKARAATARRRVRERQMSEMPEPVTITDGLWRDLEPLLDQELTCLPAKYRTPIILCDLEGKTRKEAAAQLGWAEGTVASRLARGRALLARRLTKHDLLCTGGILAAVISQHTAGAAVPLPLVVSTVKAAASFAAKQAVASGPISTSAAVLAEGVLRTMLLAKLKMATVVLLSVTLVGTGIGVLTHRILSEGRLQLRAFAESKTAGENTPQRDESRIPAEARNTLTVQNFIVDVVDVERMTISISREQLSNSSIRLMTTLHGKATPAKVLQFSPVNVINGKLMVPVQIDGMAPFQIEEGAEQESAMKKRSVPVAPDNAKGSVNIEASDVKLNDMKLAVGEQPLKMEFLRVDRNARILIRGKPGTLSDLRVGMHVTVELGLGKEQAFVQGKDVDLETEGLLVRTIRVE